RASVALPERRSSRPTFLSPPDQTCRLSVSAEGRPVSDLLYEIKDRIATITLNRPDKLNAFTGPMIDAWARALAEAQGDDNVNVVIVTGAGRAFCSGGDVGRMRQGEPSALDGKNSLWEGVHRVPKTLEAMDK